MPTRSKILGWLGVIVLLLVMAGILASMRDRSRSVETGILPRQTPRVHLPIEPADIAAPKRLKDKSIDPHFLQMHESFLQLGKSGEIQLLFLGDSITEGWSHAGSTVWTKSFSTFHPANFGLSGDRTQNLLWRIENGELASICPKAVVLMIGTNNTDYPAEDIIRADVKIAGEIREKLPQSKLLLLGILPREFSPADPVRTKIQKVNAELARLDDGASIRYLNIGDRYLTLTGTIRIELMPDLLHLSPEGYQVWADAMQPVLDQMDR